MCSVGAFGATFIQGSVIPAEAVIYAARPGLRLWKTDINGVVQTTLTFTNSAAKSQLLSRDHSSLPTTASTQNETERMQAADFPAAQFGLLQVYCSGLLVSYTSRELFVISPEDAKQVVFRYSHTTDGIVDVAVNRDEIFVLQKSSSTQHSRPLIRLTQRPSYRAHPVEVSMSYISHGQYALKNLCIYSA